MTEPESDAVATEDKDCEGKDCESRDPVSAAQDDQPQNSSGADAKKRVRRALIVLFLVVQGIYPLRALLVPPWESRTDFTWDMFAVRTDCERSTFYVDLGDGQRLRVPWGLRFPDPATDLDGFDEFESFGRGPVVLYPQPGRAGTTPALNLRRPPQVARIKHRDRAHAVGAQLCEELPEIFAEAVDENASVPGWIRRLAYRWDANGRSLGVYGDFSCRYNNSAPVDFVEPSLNLCELPGGQP